MTESWYAFCHCSTAVSLTALTHADDGSSVVPATCDDWREWVSAGDIRNFLLQDPLLDWLDSYGEERGFKRDRDLPRYDRRTDFSEFILLRGQEFEIAVLAYLKKLVSVVTIGSNLGDALKLNKAEETFAAMQSGEHVIYKGILWDANSRTYGVPDLLFRSDQLASLFPDLLTEQEAKRSAEDLAGATWHYRVVDIKFTTLKLLATGELSSSGSAAGYKGQLFIYNRALGRIQGYLPPDSYLLGRSWEQTLSGVTTRGEGCMERVAPVAQNSKLGRARSLGTEVEAASNWVRRVRREGATWSVLPEPTVLELRPNMKNHHDAPWSTAKRHIANELQDLTLLWQIGVDKRRSANNLGIYRWCDPKCTATSLGLSGAKMTPVLQAILDVNQSIYGPSVAPSRIKAAEGEWRDETKLEFYVDFETVNSLSDDFSQVPKRAGQEMIFMIGCGHQHDQKWHFECFTADALIPACEADIIDAWINHMRRVRERTAVTDNDPLVIHWSPAETSNLRDAYNAAVQRHPERSKKWLMPRWFDFLNKVIKAEPVVVRGAFAFGLKVFAQAMQRHRLIDTQWEDGPVDGLGAMIGAWWCAGEAARLKAPLRAIDLMHAIARYNEVDCKVMMEIVCYLRRNH